MGALMLTEQNTAHSTQILVAYAFTDPYLDQHKIKKNELNSNSSLLIGARNIKV